MQNKINVLTFKVDGYNCNPKMVQIADSTNIRQQLNDMYKYIGCRTVEHLSIQTHKGNNFDIWLDEEGKLKMDFNSSVMVFPIYNSTKLVDVVVGNIIITKSNEEGDIVGIDVKEANEVIEYLCKCQKLYWKF